MPSSNRLPGSGTAAPPIPMLPLMLADARGEPFPSASVTSVKVKGLVPGAKAAPKRSSNKRNGSFPDWRDPRSPEYKEVSVTLTDPGVLKIASRWLGTPEQIVGPCHSKNRG